MRVNHMGYKIRISTVMRSDMGVMYEMITEVGGVSVSQMESVNRHKFGFFKKPDETYQKEITQTIDNLIVSGKNFINDMVEKL